MLGHAALGGPDAVGGLTAVHPCVRFGHALKLLLQAETRWEVSYREQQLVRTYVDVFYLVLPYFGVYLPACPCSCRRCTECPLWPSEPCCLCTSGRWQEARWVCPYSGAPGPSPRTQSSAPRRTGHVEALRRQRGEDSSSCRKNTGFFHLWEDKSILKNLKILLLLMHFVVFCEILMHLTAERNTHVHLLFFSSDLQAKLEFDWKYFLLDQEKKKKLKFTLFMAWHRLPLYQGADTYR